MATWSLFLALSAPARAGCALDAPPDAPFTAAADADEVQVVLELWLGGAEAEWAEAILAVLDARGLGATIVVPAAPPTEAIARVLARIKKTLHDPAIALQAGEVPRDKDGARALKDAIAAVAELAGPVRTVIAPVGARQPEALLGTLGFRSIENTAGPATAEARMAGMFEGQPRVNVVLPPGPYEDACGADPHVAPFTPASADRATWAIARAARGRGTPVVRIALDGGGGRASDAEVLGRWLDEVLLPSGAGIGTAEAARQVVLRGFRDPTPAPAPGADDSGRLVQLDEVVRAAQEIGAPATLPRAFAGDLTATEAYQAFLLVAAGRNEGQIVRLTHLRGPASDARSTLSGPITLPAEEVRAAAKGLNAALPAEIPSAFPVGGHLLTAGEMLLALAGVVRGDDPVTVQPVANPDPNQRGLGWGESTLR